MDARPFLPPLNQAGVGLFVEGTNSGSKFVEISPQPYAPLNTYSNVEASPYFGGLNCQCGATNPDAQCIVSGGPMSSPSVTWFPQGQAQWEFSSPFELLPRRP